ncbi:MAG: hypothetical protein IT524_02655 [Nitrosomonas sp.]|nr:hypothetical protein [Nitrosomonas sp. JL21]MBL8496763.1 hypothetical protein [Nitrosomonas sp.]MCC7090851.1 hypothetical protein [Nitrosomonas sp.]
MNKSDEKEMYWDAFQRNPKSWPFCHALGSFEKQKSNTNKNGAQSSIFAP